VEAGEAERVAPPFYFIALPLLTLPLSEGKDKGKEGVACAEGGGLINMIKIKC